MPSLPFRHALVFLDRYDPFARVESSLPALATHYPDAIRTLTERMKADHVNIAWYAILRDHVVRIAFSRLEPYIVSCKESAKLQVVVDQLFEYVFLHRGLILPKEVTPMVFKTHRYQCRW